MIARDWYLVGASFDRTNGHVRLFRFSRRPTAGEPELVEAEAECAGDGWHTPDARLTIAASWPAGSEAPAHCFNGKIGAPALFRTVLTPSQLKAWADAGAPADHPGILARWDFAQQIASQRIVDAGPGAHHGRTRNRPTRGVTGAGMTGWEAGFPQAPAAYDAIHFHDDDVADAGWQESLSFTVPDGLPSAVYAIRLRCDGGEDHLPFVVRRHWAGQAPRSPSSCRR